MPSNCCPRMWTSPAVAPPLESWTWTPPPLCAVTLSLLRTGCRMQTLVTYTFCLPTKLKVAEDQKLLRERIQHLGGEAGIERRAGALKGHVACLMELIRVDSSLMELIRVITEPQRQQQAWKKKNNPMNSWNLSQKNKTVCFFDE